jgi:hypothetical protein
MSALAERHRGEAESDDALVPEALCDHPSGQRDHDPGQQIKPNDAAQLEILQPECLQSHHRPREGKRGEDGPSVVHGTPAIPVSHSLP